MRKHLVNSYKQGKSRRDKAALVFAAMEGKPIMAATSQEAIAVFLAMNPDEICTVCGHRLNEHMAVPHNYTKPELYPMSAHEQWTCKHPLCYCLEPGNLENPHPGAWKPVSEPASERVSDEQ